MLDGVIVNVFFQKNVGLLNLNLSWNGLYLPGSRAVGKALEKNTTLVKLDLSSNRLDRECLEKLLAGLKKNSTLTTLKVCIDSIY